MKHIIFIAPPASGKGTISKYLEDNLGYYHLSTGDLLRNEIKLNTEVGREVKEIMASGQFTPDSIILPLFKKEIVNLKDKFFILDGMPRKLNQAEYLTEVFKEMNVDNYIVINMAIDKNLLEQRIVGRRICKNCGSSYNTYFENFKPIQENICDKCGDELIKREDDNIESFQNRYEDYLRETKPIIEYYQEKGVLYTVDASQDTKDIIKDIKEILGV